MQRVVDLEEGYAEAHHDVGHGVGFREQVFYLAAGLYVPVRDAVVAHLLLRAVGQAAAFTDGLHDLEATLRLHAPGDQIEHDVVAAADGVLDRGRAGEDEVFGVAQPHVGAVGVAGKAHQGVELLGLCVHQHLAGEARAELGYAYGAGLADDGVVVGQTQRLWRAEDAPRLRVVQRYLAHVDAGHVLEHLEHGRVIVTQLVELEEVVLHAVIFKVGGDDTAARVVGGVLHGAEVLDLHVLWDDDQTARVLTRRALYADKS